MVAAGKLSLTLFLVALSSVEFELQVLGVTIHALAAASGILVAHQRFAARLHHELAASEFGYHLAKLSKFASPSTDAKLTAKKFLTQFAVQFASHTQKLLTTA